MTFRIHERSLEGRTFEREIELSVLVFPGVLIPTAMPRRETISKPPVPPKLSELGALLGTLRGQLALAYGPFTIEVRSGRHEYTIRYRFRFRVEVTHDAEPVRRWLPLTGPAMEYREPDGRTLAEIMREMSQGGFNNVAVIHRSLGGFNNCAPRISMTGEFASPAAEENRDPPGTFVRASNMMTLDLPTLEPAINRTFAHEAGHLLAMADRHYSGSDIMCNRNPDAFLRSLGARDMERLHDSVEAGPRDGVEWASGRPLSDVRRGSSTTRRAIAT